MGAGFSPSRLAGGESVTRRHRQQAIDLGVVGGAVGVALADRRQVELALLDGALRAGTKVPSIRQFAHAHHRLRLRPRQARGPRVDARVRGVRSGPRVARRRASGRAAVRLQRPHHLLLLRPLFGFHAGGGRALGGGRRRRWRARSAAGCRPPGPGPPPGPCPDSARLRERFQRA